MEDVVYIMAAISVDKILVFIDDEGALPYFLWLCDINTLLSGTNKGTCTGTPMIYMRVQFMKYVTIVCAWGEH